MIKIGKDFKRSIDFIESKDEFDINNLSYIPGAETVSEFIHLNKKGYKNSK